MNPVYVFDVICTYYGLMFVSDMYLYKSDLTCHTCTRYELQPVKDMTHGNNTNMIMIWNLKRIKPTCVI